MRAEECKCECGAQAVAFYGIPDPDLPMIPMCKSCGMKFYIELTSPGLWDDLCKKAKKRKKAL